jgi:hypothetical protein
MKVGIAVTLHWSTLYRPNGNLVFNKFIESFRRICPRHQYVFYFIDNQSEFKFNLPIDLEHKYFYVKNQLLKGLTGAWNLGMEQAYLDGCDVIINSNDDIEFDDSLNLFVDDIISNEFKNSSVFGPRTNKSAKGHPNSLPAENTPYTYLDVEYGVNKNLLYGFCFGLTRKSYEMGKYTHNEFFPYEIESIYTYDAWGSQEWYFSILRSKDFKSIICNRAYFKHLRLNTWMHHHPNYSYKTKSIININKIKSII